MSNVKKYTLKVHKYNLDKLKLIKIQYGLSSLNDALLFLIMKYENCDKYLDLEDAYH